jgi:hypothetical protein
MLFLFARKDWGNSREIAGWSVFWLGFYPDVPRIQIRGFISRSKWLGHWENGNERWLRIWRDFRGMFQILPALHTQDCFSITVGNQFACRDRLRVTQLWSVWIVLSWGRRILQPRSDFDFLRKLGQAVAALCCQWHNLTSPVNEQQTACDGWRLRRRDTAELSVFVRHILKNAKKAKITK